MVRVRALLLLTPLVVAVGVTFRADAKPATTPDPGTIRLGLMSTMFRDVPPALVQAAQGPFRDLFKKQVGLTGEVEVSDDYEALAKKINDQKLDLGVFHGFEWAWVQARYPDLQPLVVTVPYKPLQACLVVHTKHKADEPAGLDGPCVAIPLGLKAHSHLYYERLQKNLPAGCCRPISKGKLGPVEALDNVCSETTAAALVDRSTYLAFESNQPGKARQLKVIAQSDPFPPTVVICRKDGLTPDTIARIRKGLVEAENKPQGRAFLFLWGLKGFANVPADYNAQLQKVLKLYPAPRPVQPQREEAPEPRMP